MDTLGIKNSGQAMTETLITASMIMVPLFLLIPMLGKYIDIQHSTIQTARYEAWEYTVWYNRPANKMPSGVTYTPNSTNAVPLPEKDFTDLQAEARQRFFSRTAFSPDPSVAALTNSDNTRWDITDTNELWKDHRRISIFSNTNSIDSIADNKGDTPDGQTAPALDVALEIGDKIFGGARNIISFFTGSLPRFDVVNLEGYSLTDVTVPVTTPQGFIEYRTMSGAGGAGNPATVYNLAFNSRAAVLSDGWNAGGSPHVIYQSSEMAVTKNMAGILNSVPGFNLIQGFLGFALPELRPCQSSRSYPPGPLRQFDPDGDGSFWMGYVDTEAVHPDRLHEVTNNVANANHIGGGPNNQGHQCITANNMNACQFAYNVPGNPGYTYPHADPTVFDDGCN